MAGVTSHCTRCGSVLTVPHAARPMPTPAFGAMPTRAPTAPAFPAASTPAPPYAFGEPGGAPRSSIAGLPPIVLIAAAAGLGIVGLLLVLILGRSLSGPRDAARNPDGVEMPQTGLLDQLASGTGIQFEPPPTSPVFGRDPFGDAGNDDRSLPVSTSASSTATPLAAKGGSLKIPVPSSGDYQLGPPGCPVVATRDTIWQLANHQPIAKLTDERIEKDSSALSEDGHWLAQELREYDSSGRKRDRMIRVWDARTGNVARNLSLNNSRQLRVLQFVRNDYLLVGLMSPPAILPFHIPTGREFPAISLPADTTPDRKFTIARDGRRMAWVDGEQIRLVRTATGETEASIAAPRGVDPRRNDDPNEPRNIASNIVQLEFSPDGNELAALVLYPQRKLMCWNSRGETVVDESVHALLAGKDGLPNFVWLPDGSGWLCDIHLIDRRSKQCVYRLHHSYLGRLPFRFADRNYLIGGFPHDEHHISALPIPWNAINKSLQAFESGAPAYVGRKSPIGIQVEVQGVQRNPDETKRLLIASLTRRMTQIGIPVANDARATFRLRLVATREDELTLRQPGRQKAFGPPAETRTVRPVLGTLHAALYVPGKSQPFWEDRAKALSSLEYHLLTDDDTLERTMLNQVAGIVENLHFPYFVPESSDLVVLPYLQSSLK